MNNFLLEKYILEIKGFICLIFKFSRFDSNL